MVVTSRTRNAVVGIPGTWVRIPSFPPRKAVPLGRFFRGGKDVKANVYVFALSKNYDRAGEALPEVPACGVWQYPIAIQKEILDFSQLVCYYLSMDKKGNNLKKDFLDDIRKGLGRAYLTLLNAPDKNDYLETIVFASLTNSAYYCICEGPKSTYLFKFIKLYGEATRLYIKKIIVESLSVNDERDLLFQKLDILYEYYLDGETTVSDDILCFYDKFVSETKIWTRKKLLSFEILAIVLDRVFGIEKTKDVIHFISEKKLDTEYLGWYQSKLKDRYKENENILDFANKAGSGKSQFKFYDSAEEFINGLFFPKVCRSMFTTNSEKECKKLWDVLAETDNLTVARSILGIFGDKYLKSHIPLTLLFDLLDKFGTDIEKEVYENMSFYKSEQVKNLGLKLIRTSKYRLFGLLMLFNNYSTDLKDVIIENYKKVQFSFYGNSTTFTYATAEFMNHKKSGYPDEILVINYYKNYDSFCRENIVRIMKKRGVLSSSIIEECKYDSNYEVVKLAYRYLSCKKA